MMSRFLAPAAVLALALGCASRLTAADKSDLPPATAQTLPVGKLLADVKATMRLAAGPDAEAAIKKFDQMLEDKLGEKGFEGLDLTRPPAACLFLPEKFDLDKLSKNPPDPEAFEEFYGFVLVPITNEKDFLGFLGRVGVEVKKVPDAKGLYAIIPDGKDADDDPALRLRFHAGYAYVGINVDDADMAAADLPPAADVIAPAESALLSYRVFYQRLPGGLKDGFRDFLKKLPEMTDKAPLPDEAKKALTPLLDLYKRFGDRILTDGDAAVVRVKLDPATGDAGYEVALATKSGTPLAKEIAARKPSTNQFAGLLGADTAAGFLVQLPLFAPEIRDAVAVGLKAGQKATADQVPDQFKELAAELWKGVGRTVKDGEFDLAAAVAGPDKDGHYAVTAAISYVGAADLEKVLRKLHADAPEEIQNQVKLDAATVNGVKVHRMPAGLFLPPEAKKVFGDRPSVALAFGPKGVYATFGPDSIGAMKAALAFEPGPAKSLDVVVNPAKVGKLAEAAKGEQGARDVAAAIGTEDGLVSLLYVTLESGAELVLRYGTNVKLFGQAFVTRVAEEK